MRHFTVILVLALCACSSNDARDAEAATEDAGLADAQYDAGSAEDTSPDNDATTGDATDAPGEDVADDATADTADDDATDDTVGDDTGDDTGDAGPCGPGAEQNACGGCTALEGRPGEACACEEGAWACDGTDALTCLTASGEPLYPDRDEDGFGDPDGVVEVGTDACAQSYVDNADDCDDDESTVSPGSPMAVCDPTRTRRGVCVSGREVEFVACDTEYCEDGRCVPCISGDDTTCTEGVCVNNACEVCRDFEDELCGDLYCDGNTCVECSVSRRIPCEEGTCFEGTCLPCHPGTTRCTDDAQSVEMCQTDGTWAVSDTCWRPPGRQQVCDDGVCGPRPCVPGVEQRCQNTERTIQICNEDGLTWSDYLDCGPGARCRGNSCSGETCDNGLDDDFDGAVDCHDVSCTLDPACTFDPWIALVVSESDGHMLTLRRPISGEEVVLGDDVTGGFAMYPVWLDDTSTLAFVTWDVPSRRQLLRFVDVTSGDVEDVDASDVLGCDVIAYPNINTDVDEVIFECVGDPSMVMAARLDGSTPPEILVDNGAGPWAPYPGPTTMSPSQEFYYHAVSPSYTERLLWDRLTAETTPWGGGLCAGQANGADLAEEDDSCSRFGVTLLATGAGQVFARPSSAGGTVVTWERTGLPDVLLADEHTLVLYAALPNRDDIDVYPEWLP